MTTRGRFALHHTSLEVSWDRPELETVVTAILRYYGATPCHGSVGESAVPESDAVFRLVSEAATHRFEPPPGARLEGDFGGVRVWVEGDRVWVVAQGFCFEVDLAEGQATGRLAPGVWRSAQDGPAQDGSAQDGSLALGQNAIVPFVLAWMILLRRRQLYAVHGAAVARRGDGCLFLAGGGCGKSTQALGMVVAGWDHLSDDSWLLDAAPEGAEDSAEVEVLALRRDFYLTPEAATPFPGLASAWEACGLTGGVKRKLSMATVFPGQIATRCRPRWTIFPRLVDADTSRLVPLAKPEALHQLLHQSDLVTLDPRTAPRHLDALRRLLDQAPSYELLAGRDLKTTPEAVEPLLRPLTGVARKG